MSVKIVKMINGEELIGNYDEVRTTISDPVVMIPVSKEKIAFQPWLPYAEDKEYKLKESMIVIVANPSSTIMNEYNRIFGSGLVVPDNPSNIIM